MEPMFRRPWRVPPTALIFEWITTRNWKRPGVVEPNMGSMAYVPLTVAKGGFAGETSVRERFGFSHRLMNAMMDARHRQAEREIARAISAITDSP